ncbi:MAG TPA: tryptophan synthase subunit alpha [Solirubrobacteraceae bacterium]|nr:tryptophan synthase subunit alpha [Solirubrobacteraceae bacterium]
MNIAGEERIAAAFAGSGKRAALMPYLMGGFPDLEGSLRIGAAAAAAGADMIELGIPFSDPLADGPVIHAAATRALAAGATVERVLEVAAALAAQIPVIVMTYANIVIARGVDVFLDRLAQAGVSGLIVPDLPFEEGAQTAEAAAAAGIALVPLIAPTTTAERLELIGARARGFLYVVSVTGTTGERSQSGGDAVRALLERAHSATAVPVALGFGISTPDQAAAAADAGADGVIVGSRLVRAAGEESDGAAAVGGLVAELAAALA